MNSHNNNRRQSDFGELKLTSAADARLCDMLTCNL